MNADDARALIVAHRVWHAAARAASPGQPAGKTADVVLTALESGLRRWVGAEGYAALLNRCVSDTQQRHPVLQAFPDFTELDPDLAPDALHAAVVALLECMMHELSEVVGWELGIRLLELSVAPLFRGLPSAESQEAVS